jgi:hypothetical protein
LTHKNVHENTLLVNIIQPFIDKLLPFLEEHFPACRRWRPARPPRREIQLEFHWQTKK